jgi:hypothetical protein
MFTIYFFVGSIPITLEKQMWKSSERIDSQIIIPNNCLEKKLIMVSEANYVTFGCQKDFMHHWIFCFFVNITRSLFWCRIKHGNCLLFSFFICLFLRYIMVFHCILSVGWFMVFNAEKPCYKWERKTYSEWQNLKDCLTLKINIGDSWNENATLILLVWS